MFICLQMKVSTFLNFNFYMNEAAYSNVAAFAGGAMEKDLQVLVEEAIRGDEASLAELCNEKMRVILYTSLKYTRNMTDAEEVAQEVLIRVYRGIGSLKSPKAFNVWLHKIIKNEYMMFRKKAQKEKGDITMNDVEDMFSVTDTSAIPHAHLEDEEKRQELLALIETLPDNYKHTLIMFFYEGMSYKEIAEVLSVSTKVVANNLMRAKKALLKKLEVSEEEEKKAGSMWFGGMMAAAITSDMTLQFSDIQVQAVLSRATAAAQQTTGQNGPSQSPKPSLAKVASIAAAGVVGVGVLIGGILYATSDKTPEPRQNEPAATHIQPEKPLSSAGAEQSLPQHDAPSAEEVDIYSPSPEQSGVMPPMPSVKPSVKPSTKPSAKRSNSPKPSASPKPSISVAPSEEPKKAGLVIHIQVDPAWAHISKRELGNAEVRLYPKGQTSGVLAKASIGSNFVADFGQLSLAAGTYDVYIKLDRNAGYMLTDGTYSTWQSVAINPGNTASVAAYVKPIAVCKIVFAGGASGSVTNPKSVVVQGDVLPNASVEWVVVYGGQTVATVSGDEINATLHNLVVEGVEGVYSLSAKTKNIYGQDIRISTTFAISRTANY